LQELTRTGSRRAVAVAIFENVSGNLVVSAVAIAIVATLIKRGRINHITYLLGCVLGIIGAIVRINVDVIVWGESLDPTDGLVVVTEGVWLLLAGALTQLICGFAARVLAEQTRLAEMVDTERKAQTLMVHADRRLRQSIAEWLHGRLQAELLVAASDARRLGPAGGGLAERLDAVRTTEVRRLAYSLHPALVEIDLDAALREMVSRNDPGGIVTVDYRDETAEMFDTAVPGVVAVSVHRIVEEGLLNALQHSQPSFIRVAVRISATVVDITVQNDGAQVGLEVQPGLGLRIIDAWVNSGGGTWQLTADGTTVTLRAQLRYEQPRPPTADHPTRVVVNH
jgi:signal transduction histidine kinase